MSALADQIEHARTLIAALVPETLPGSPFVLEGRDQQAPVGLVARRFVVRADTSAPTTTGWFGAPYRTVRARFLVMVRHDSLGDFEQDDRIFVEDTDQIVSALEVTSARVSSDVMQIVCVDRIVEPVDEQGRQMSLVFEVDYRVAV